MARLNTNAEVWASVSEFGGIRDLDGATLDSLANAATKGGTTIEMTTDLSAEISAGDYIRIGSDDKLEVHVVETVATTTVTLETALLRDHAAGEEVIEQELVNFGAVADDGVNVDHSGTQNEIRASTQPGVYVVLLQEVSAEISCNLLNYSMENLAVTLGIPESEITGTGAAGDPYQLGMVGDVFDSLNNFSLYLRGARKDGATFEILGFDAGFDGNVARNLLRGQQTNLPVAATVQGGVVWRLTTV